MFSFLWTLFLVAAVIFVGYRMVVGFRAAEGSIWQRLVTAGEDSATMTWGYVQIMVGGLLDILVKIAGYLNLPELANFIQLPAFSQYTSIAFIVIGAITLLARMRTLFKDAA